jgi:hypothetical protein
MLETANSLKIRSQSPFRLTCMSLCGEKILYHIGPTLEFISYHYCDKKRLKAIVKPMANKAASSRRTPKSGSAP